MRDTSHSITFTGVAFHYSNPYSEVFNDLNLSLDTHWKTGLIGRNGRGKSTLIGLVSGSLQSTKGQVHTPVETLRLVDPESLAPLDDSITIINAARLMVGPYTAWEVHMAELLEDGSPEALSRYSELHDRYLQSGGYEVNSLLLKELELLGIDQVENTFFSTLSLGQKTRVAIASLFARQKLTGQHGYPLIDEPTNHLDIQGRRLLADYLSTQSGFLLISHDRTLLDSCTDHTLSINRQDTLVTQGSFSTWKMQFERGQLHEQRVRQNIESEVKHLQQAATERRQHAGSKESEKYGTGAFDKGHIGHRAAKQMKRALAAERRIEQQLTEKQGLLNNAEKPRELRIQTNLAEGRQALAIHQLDISLGETSIVENFSLTLEAGERVALTGPNGCGKTTLLRAIQGQLPYTGTIRCRTNFSSLSQQDEWSQGLLRDQLRREEIDETRFRQLLGSLDVRGDVFEQPLESLSHGQRKKAALCRSLLNSSGLLIWDEPMNYLDVDTREMLEDAILQDRPTMLFVEHDERFVNTVATRIIELS